MKIKNKFNILLLIIAFSNMASCDFKKETDNNKHIATETKYVDTASGLNYRTVWSKFPLRKTPLIDSTNFDNTKPINLLSSDDIAELQLIKLYPNFDKEGYEYTFSPSYKLDFGDFNSIVVNVFKGEHELESVLIIYNADNKLSKYYQDDKLVTNSIVLAYDEIAEGWTRTTSQIKNNYITTINALYTEPPVIDTLHYQITQFGDIHKIDTDFKSVLRPDEKISLNKIYKDTLEFSHYNDDGDYFLLTGKKNGNDVAFTYDWNHYDSKKYNFKYGDIINVEWKMDSIFIAGDGETLYFSETAIDAIKIKSISTKENIDVKEK